MNTKFFRVVNNWTFDDIERFKKTIWVHRLLDREARITDIDLTSGDITFMDGSMWKLCKMGYFDFVKCYKEAGVSKWTFPKINEMLFEKDDKDE